MIYSVNTGTCTSLDIFPYYTTTGTGKTWNYKKKKMKNNWYAKLKCW